MVRRLQVRCLPYVKYEFQEFNGCFWMQAVMDSNEWKHYVNGDQTIVT